MKDFLDPWVDAFKTPAFIERDPLQFPHRFIGDAQACELVAFFTALFSYGRREKILETVEGLLETMNQDPTGFIETFNPKKDRTLFRTFVYRFNTGEDLVYLFSRLQWVYREFGSLESFFLASASLEVSLKEKIAAFWDAFMTDEPVRRYGLKFLMAHPAKGGACKRFNMFLRWMVRQDDVDLGLWRSALNPADLMIPLDTHVVRMAKLLALTQRNPNDWRTAEEITDVFRRFCPEDPIKYDFALFGLGIEGWNTPVKGSLNKKRTPLLKLAKVQ